MAAIPASSTRRLLAEAGCAATVHWNLLIAGASRRQPLAALTLFKSMQASGILANDYTFPSLLQSSAALQNPLHPLQLHGRLVRLGLLRRHAAAALIHAYGKCSLPDHALRLFDEIPSRELDPVLWTALISSLSGNGRVAEGFGAFSIMRCSGTGAGDDAGAVAALVSGAGELRHGQMLHALAIKQGLDAVNLRLANTFVNMYARLADGGAACNCFRAIPATLRDVISWNTTISGLAMNGDSAGALALFDEMLAAGEPPNRVTIISVLKAAAQLGSREIAGNVHDYVLSRHRPPAIDVVVMTALVDLQARCGEVEKAREIFNTIEKKNTVCWSAMIAGYEQNSMPEEALSLFKLMMAEDKIRPNPITLLSVISAAAAVGAVGLAGAIHELVVSAGAGEDDRVFSSLIDMYAKCGELPLARKLFSERDRSSMSVISWTAMVGAEGMHGGGREALSLFAEMQEKGFRPNEVTFIAIISGCSHAGLVEEGISCFQAMERDHGISPNQKHYSCIVDLLGRAGKLQEALDLLERMPIEADLPVWGSLLGACRVHGDTRLGELVERRIQCLPTPWNSAGHLVLLANLYSRGGRREDAIRVRVALRSSRRRKIAGRSFVTVGSAVYGFTAGDLSHGESDLIYEELRALDVRVKASGYARKTISNQAAAAAAAGSKEEEEEEGGEFHSERLAMAFWMMMCRRRRSGTEGPLRIMKNLRVCEDCHEYTKAVSKVIGRELIVRDSRRFHHFNDGVCSCGDYW